MPLNSIPATTTVEAFEAKRSAARGRCHVDVASWGSVVAGNASEVEAIRLMIRLAREFRTHVHIVHVAAAEAVDELAQAQAGGVAITAETCPHYLSFAAEEIPHGATEFKCAPPVREARHRDALWNALARGTLALVATDHSPAPAALKSPGDFMRAWGGVASLELSLSATWTGLAARPGHAPDQADYLGPVFVPRHELSPLARLSTWMSAA